MAVSERPFGYCEPGKATATVLAEDFYRELKDADENYPKVAVKLREAALGGRVTIVSHEGEAVRHDYPHTAAEQLGITVLRSVTTKEVA